MIEATPLTTFPCAVWGCGERSVATSKSSFDPPNCGTNNPVPTSRPDLQKGLASFRGPGIQRIDVLGQQPISLGTVEVHELYPLGIDLAKLLQPDIARPGMLDAVFSAADQVPRAKLEEWFDQQTGQMGGEDAVRVVQDLLGHAQHFDFAQVSEKVPKLDLPDLAPFFRLALRYNRRQVTETDGMLAFKTPEPWQRTPGIKPRYEDAHFERRRPSPKKGTILGVGSRVFDAALGQACQLKDSYAASLQGERAGMLLVYRTYDRITGNPAQPKSIVLGVLHEGGEFRMLKDWQVLQSLNELASSVKTTPDTETTSKTSALGDQGLLTHAEVLVRKAFPSLDLPFRAPELELLGIIKYAP